LKHPSAPSSGAALKKSPGLKSDILHGNSPPPFFRRLRPPPASSHICAVTLGYSNTEENKLQAFFTKKRRKSLGTQKPPQPGHKNFLSILMNIQRCLHKQVSTRSDKPAPQAEPRGNPAQTWNSAKAFW
jgi:hypothetical protein